MAARAGKLLKNVYVFSVVSRVLMLAAGFLYSIVLARYLGPALKGQLAYINTVTAVTVIVFSFGIHQAYPYYKKQKTPGIGQTYTHVCFIVLGGYVLAALGISALLGDRDERVTIAVLLTPLLTFTKLAAYRVMVEEPNRKNAWEVMCELAEVAALLILLAFFERSLYYCLAVIVGKNVLSCAYYLHRSQADLRIRREDFTAVKRFAAFGFLPMLSLLMNHLNYRVDVLMLGRAVTDQQTGVYSVGIQIAERMWLVSDTLRDALFSKLIKGRDSEEVNRVIRVCFTISAIIDLGIILVGRPFIRVCYGAEYADAYGPLVIVLFGTLVMVFYKIIQTYNIVHHKQRINFVFLALSVLTNVGMNAIFIPRYGINGAAAASLISYTLCALLFMAEYARSTGARLGNMLFINRGDIHLMLSALKKGK